jgi:hypothetical protein
MKDAHERKMKEIIRAAGRHKSAKLLPTYAKRTIEQVAESATGSSPQSAGALGHDGCGATVLATCRSAHTGIGVRIWSG